MLKNIAVYTAIIFYFLWAFPASANQLDTRGTEFIFGFQPNHDFLEVGGVVYISSRDDTEGKVALPGLEWEKNFTINAGEVLMLRVPSMPVKRNGSFRTAVHLTSTKDVSVYALSQDKYSTDGFAVFPIHVLGNEYRVATYDAFEAPSLGGIRRLATQTAIASTVDGNLVEITPSIDFEDKQAGVPFSVILDKDEVYQLSSDLGDFTGTLITSSYPVAVFGGHRCADIPHISRSPTGGRIGACDHLVEMLPPMNTWGKSFLVSPLATRTRGSFIRVLAGDEPIVVEINAEKVGSLNPGEYLEKLISGYGRVTTTGPALVTQYSPGSTFDDVPADPFMVVIPPDEQFLSEYFFSTAGDLGDQIKKDDTSHYINIIIPTSALDTLKLDGNFLDVGLFVNVDNVYSGAQIVVSDGSHHIVADAPFSLIVYGYAEYDSYGYLGGMAFVNISPPSDNFSPSIRNEFDHVGNTYLGAASDSEDINVNGILDAGEDINGNGKLDQRNEDTNFNGVLDAGEDLNGNGVIDKDRGIFSIELTANSENLILQVLGFSPGEPSHMNFRVDLVDPFVPGSGVVRVTDVAGNFSDVSITMPAEAALRDVQVISTVSGDGIAVDQASFSRAPVSITEQANSTVVEWHFDTILADQLETINYDVTLENPQPDEQRVVTQNLQLSYINQYGGERVTTELPAQTVLVSNSAFSLFSSLNKALFGPDDVVRVSVQIDNNGTVDNAGSVDFIIEDTQGVSITTLASETFSAVAPGASQTLSQVWNTGAIYAGNYRARVVLKDSSGRVNSEKVLPFSVVGSTANDEPITIDMVVGENAGGIFVSRNKYHTTDAVYIRSRLTNVTKNELINSGLFALTITSPSGEVLLSESTIVNSELAPDAIVNQLNSLMLSEAEEGSYQVRGEFVDSQSGVTIASSTSSFTVVTNLAQSVGGTVWAKLPELLLGDTQTCTDTVVNRLLESPLDLEVQTSIGNIDTQVETHLQSNLLSVSANGNHTESRQETVGGSAGEFACFLKINTGSGLQTLAFAKFSVYQLIADPGADITAYVGEHIMLNGSASREADNRPLTYQWRFIRKPENSTAQLVNADSVTSSFVVDEQGEYVIELVVENGSEVSRPKQLVVTTPNRSAVANAGLDQLVAAGDTAMLDATGSSDQDGDMLTYQWRILQKPALSTSELSETTSATPELFIDVSGIYQLELIVNDGFTNSAPDTVLLNVGNLAPVADAGKDLAVELDDIVTLDGSGSFDINGDNIHYSWSLVSKPEGSQAALINYQMVKPVFQVDKAGDYVISLVAGDELEISEPDTVTVSVGNAVPVANAGVNQSGQPGDLISLDGSSSYDLNEDPLTYRWSIISKPADSTATLINALSVNPHFGIDVQGSYIVQLVVNDGMTDSQVDTVLVTGNNIKPLALVYEPETRERYTGDSVSLDGTPSYDPEGASITYHWALIERPDGSSALLEGAATGTPSFVMDQPGDYVAQLIVNDGQVNSEPYTVYIGSAQVCVADLAIRPKYDKIQLTWTHNPQTESVEIQRSNALAGPYEFLAETDSTYATYLDTGLAYGPNYYYRIKGHLLSAAGEACTCDEEDEWDSSEGILSCPGDIQCGGMACYLDEVGLRCIDYDADRSYACDVTEESNMAVTCPEREGGDNQCEPGDGFCEFMCEEYAENPEFALSGEYDFDFDQCGLPPAASVQQCSSQVIASAPVGRVRLTVVPALFGMTVAEAQQALTANNLTVGSISYQRTTAVPDGYVIQQDVPKASVMAQGTAVDLLVSTRAHSE